MQRRHFLGLVAATGVLSGCVMGGASGGGGDDTTIKTREIDRGEVSAGEYDREVGVSSGDVIRVGVTTLGDRETDDTVVEVFGPDGERKRSQEVDMARTVSIEVDQAGNYRVTVSTTEKASYDISVDLAS